MQRDILRRLAVVVVGAALVQGCGSFDRGDDSAPPASPAPPAPPTSRAPSQDSTAYGSVPRSAERVVQGRGTIRWRAGRGGRVWIGNETRRVVVTETRVRPGEEVVVEP